MKRYVEEIVIAKPNWCVPAVLEMLLIHCGIKTLSQTEIAEQLDIVPAEGKIDHKKWGAQIKNNTINDFLRQIPYNCTRIFFRLTTFRMNSF